MTDVPAFQLYPKDLLAGLAATYSIEEFGAFMLLLSFEWTLNGLPVEPEKLAKLLRVSTRKFHALWAVIGDQFPEADGRRYNAELQLQREKQAAWREKSSEGGRKSAAKRGARVVQPPLVPQGQPNGNIAIALAVKEKKEPKGAAAPRGKRPAEPAPWMGLMRKAWTFGDLLSGDATLLRPVVKELGPEEVSSRLARYCERADQRFASVRQFVAKHALYADAAPPAQNGDAPRVPRATEGLIFT